VQRFLKVLLVAAAAYVAWIFLSRQAATRRWVQQHEKPAVENPLFAKTYLGNEVKILQFYARDGNMTEGTNTVICYGVVNAKSVKIEPPVDGVGVSINRCVETAPGRDTHYTLSAEGADGAIVSESLDLRVTADQDQLPQITAFGVADRKKDYLGRPVYLVKYSDRNGEEISIDPPIFQPMHRAPYGQFYVAPTQTTTYTLRVKNKFGHVATKQLTLEVPAK
jgi:hypothetical protein